MIDEPVLQSTIKSYQTEHRLTSDRSDNTKAIIVTSATHAVFALSD